MSTLMNYEETVGELSKRGWKKYPASSGLAREIWCKRFAAPVCQCNSDKDGIQIAITVYDPYQPEFGHSYEIDLTAEKPDGQWVELKVYSIQESLISILDAQCAALIKAWEAVQ